MIRLAPVIIKVNWSDPRRVDRETDHRRHGAQRDRHEMDDGGTEKGAEDRAPVRR